jgi:hypothetical protein
VGTVDARRAQSAGLASAQPAQGGEPLQEGTVRRR